MNKKSNDNSQNHKLGMDSAPAKAQKQGSESLSSIQKNNSTPNNKSK